MISFKSPVQAFKRILLKPLPRLTPTSCLGIDIGTSSIKIVELSRSGVRVKLDNYGEISTAAVSKGPFRTSEENTIVLSSSDIGKAITAVLEEAKIQTKSVVFAIPDFSSFFTNFQLPPMTKKEISDAINFAATQYIPLPLSEVTLDWQLIEGKIGGRSKEKLKILLVAVPTKVISQYQEIAIISKLKAKSLEAEAFALLRSIRGIDKITVGLVDIGDKSTTCSIVENGMLKSSNSLDIGGDGMTKSIAEGADLDYNDAEKLKKQYGVAAILKEGARGHGEGEKITKAFLPLIDSILDEVQKIFRNFSREEKKDIQKVVLAGGTSLLPGLREYFFSVLKKETEIINPFANMNSPQILDKTLQEMGPRYAIAVGAALRGLD